MSDALRHESSSGSLRDRLRRVELWLFVDASRWTVIGLLTAAVFASVALAVILAPPTVTEYLLQGTALAKGYVELQTIDVTVITLVLSINQLVLTPELGSIGQQRSRLDAVLENRTKAAELVDAPTMPTEPTEEDDTGATLLPSEQVYTDLDQLEATTKALAETVDGESVAGLDDVSSNRINLDAVDEYYGTLIDRGVSASDMSPIADCDFAELKEYALIDDESVDVLVLRTEDEREAVSEIRRDFTDGEYDEARSRLGELTDRRVSVRVQPDQDEHPIEASLDTLGPTQVFVLDLSDSDDARWYGEIAGVMG